MLGLEGRRAHAHVHGGRRVFHERDHEDEAGTRHAVELAEAQHHRTLPFQHHVHAAEQHGAGQRAHDDRRKHHVSHAMPANRKNTISVSTHRSAVAPVRLVVVSSNCASVAITTSSALTSSNSSKYGFFSPMALPYRSSSFANSSSIRVIASARETPVSRTTRTNSSITTSTGESGRLSASRSISAMVERFPRPDKISRRSPDPDTPYGWCCSLPPAEWPARAP